MKVLVACEESQAVTKEIRLLTLLNLATLLKNRKEKTYVEINN